MTSIQMAFHIPTLADQTGDCEVVGGLCFWLLINKHSTVLYYLILGIYSLHVT